MKQDFPIITLCGSTRFKDEFLACARELNLQGNIVLSPFVFSGCDGTVLDDEQIRMLDEMHKRKIDMSDSIMVINVDDYIGESTGNEIAYAERHGVSVAYRFPHEETE